jgi:hypothetical protein
VGAQLSEVLNAEVTSGEERGFSRRRVVKGVAWSVPVIVTAIAAPAAAASPPPTPTVKASATITAAAQPVPSSSVKGGGQDRPSVTVPTTFSLKDLGGVTGSIHVAITISPVTQATGDPALSLSTVKVGAAQVTLNSPNLTANSLTAGANTFTANFDYTVPAGTAQVDFAFSGYTYRGLNKDHRTFDMTLLTTFQERGVTTQLSTTYSPITL